VALQGRAFRLPATATEAPTVPSTTARPQPTSALSSSSSASSSSSSWWGSWLWGAAPSATTPAVAAPALPATVTPVAPPPAVAGTATNDAVVKLAAGDDHVIAMTATGRVWAAAQSALGNAQGQLGQGAESPAALAPAAPTVPLQFYPVHGLAHVAAADVACGQQHTLVRTGEGDVYAFGSNRWCQLGQGVFRDDALVLSAPVKVRAQGVASAHAHTHTHAIEAACMPVRGCAYVCMCAYVSDCA
jgi:hypothetical protein